MKKQYTLLEIVDMLPPKDRNRRMVGVRIRVREVPETQAEQGKASLDQEMYLAYPAYGHTHYVASIDFLNKMEGQLNHNVAMECKELVEQYWKIWFLDKEDDL